MYTHIADIATRKAEESIEKKTHTSIDNSLITWGVEGGAQRIKRRTQRDVSHILRLCLHKLKIKVVVQMLYI